MLRFQNVKPPSGATKNYLIELSAENVQELTNALRAIQPEFKAPAPVAVDEEGRTTRCKEIANLLAWHEVPKSTQQEIATQLAGCIGWQLRDFTFDADIRTELLDDIRGVPPGTHTTGEGFTKS